MPDPEHWIPHSWAEGVPELYLRYFTLKLLLTLPTEKERIYLKHILQAGSQVHRARAFVRVQCLADSPRALVTVSWKSIFINTLLTNAVLHAVHVGRPGLSSRL